MGNCIAAGASFLPKACGVLTTSCRGRNPIPAAAGIAQEIPFTSCLSKESQLRKESRKPRQEWDSFLPRQEWDSLRVCVCACVRACMRCMDGEQWSV